MMKLKNYLLCSGMLMSAMSAMSQTTGYSFSSVEGSYWKMAKVTLADKVIGQPLITIRANEGRQTFKGWGTCFNELPYDAYCLMSAADQQLFARRVFNLKGDLRLTVGRIPIGASDYARSWYSCDEINTDETDFDMTHFNIDRDLTTVIPSIKIAQEQNPEMWFWASPWSPPTWMKTNKHYAQRKTSTNGCPFDVPPYFNDQFIANSQYYQAYCLYFDKFINAYKQQGIPIKSLAYQNEAYSNTPYPGCSWKAATTGKFYAEYLGPYFAVHQPDVSLMMGTMNTASTDVFETILNTPGVDKYVKQIGFQWEGANALPEMCRRHPGYEMALSEVECGSGTFDWSAAAHTFQLLNHNLANNVTFVSYWNAILKDNGISEWGWVQNALVQVNSATNKPKYTAEYYAYKHYSHLIAPGSTILTCDEANMITVAKTPENAIVVVAGNNTQAEKQISMDIDGKYFIAILPANSFTTYFFGSDDASKAMLKAEAEGLVEIESGSLDNQKTAILNAAISNADAGGTDATDRLYKAVLTATADTVVAVKHDTIANPLFVDGAASWTVGNVANGGDFRSNTIAGRTCWNNWSNNFTSMNLSQHLDGIIPGVYNVSCVSMCGPGEITDQHVYALAQCDTIVSPVKKVAIWNTVDGWEQQTTTDAVVGSDGTLTVGYASTSGGSSKGWFCVSDFQLHKVTEGVDEIVGAVLAASIERAKSIEKSNEQLASALMAAEAAAATDDVDEQLRALSVLRAAITVCTVEADTLDMSAYLTAKHAAEEIIGNEKYASPARASLQTLINEQGETLKEVSSQTSLDDLTRELVAESEKVKTTQQPAETTDFSFLIQNPGVESSDGWLLSNTNGDATVKSGQYYTGDVKNTYFDSYNGTKGNLWYTGHQTLTDVPNGIYRLTCIARADGNGAYLTADTQTQRWKTAVVNNGNVGGQIWTDAAEGTDAKTANGGNGFGWGEYAIDSVVVDDNILTVGFTNDKFLTGTQWDGTWFSFDDFHLTYLSANTVTAAKADAVLPSDGENVRSGKGCIIVTASTPYVVYDGNGILQSRTDNLNQGMYIVRINGNSYKVLVH